MFQKFNGIKYVDSQVEAITGIWMENIQKTLFWESLIDLPHMEPRLRQLYMETFTVTMLGFWNVSIIMQGVLLEALVKEIIFAKEKKDFQEPFGDAIKTCEDKSYLTKEEIKFLKQFKDKIRNIYQHVDIKKLAGKVMVPAWKIPIEREKAGESLYKGVKEVMEGRAGKPKSIGYDEARAIGVIAKEKFDQKMALPLFNTVEKFVRELAAKHFSEWNH